MCQIVFYKIADTVSPRVFDRSINSSSHWTIGRLSAFSLIRTTFPILPSESLTSLLIYDDATFFKKGRIYSGSNFVNASLYIVTNTTKAHKAPQYTQAELIATNTTAKEKKNNQSPKKKKKTKNKKKNKK